MLDIGPLRTGTLDIDPCDIKPRDIEPGAIERNDIERPSAARRVRAGSHLTLHYRLTLLPGEVDLVDTFDGKPATLQLGIGQLAEPLERLLFGLAEGDGQVFELAPGAAFGHRQDGLVMRLSRAALASTAALEIGEPIEVLAPDGKRVVGSVRALDDRDVTLDFNHPLAGQAIRFTVRLIGIL
jgi:FKBP-type peptidyl-prolyl cis-trans isomerase SlpA